jgi:hypothetical protein
MLACLSLILAERSSLKTLRSERDVRHFLSHPHGGLDSLGLIKLLTSLRAHTPTLVLFRSTTLEIEAEEHDVTGASGSGSSGDEEEKEEEVPTDRDCRVGAPPWPLPRAGPYPPLKGFPRFTMDFQLAQRGRMVAAKEEARMKQALVDEVAGRAKALALKEEQWAERQAAVNKAEAARQEQIRASNDRHMQEEVKKGLKAQRRNLELALQLSEHASESLERSVTRSEQHAAMLEVEAVRAEARVGQAVAAVAEDEAIGNAVAAAAARMASRAAALEDEERARYFASEVRDYQCAAPLL